MVSPIPKSSVGLILMDVSFFAFAALRLLRHATRRCEERRDEAISILVGSEIASAKIASQ